MIPIQFDSLTFVLVCLGFYLVCAGVKKAAEAHVILKKEKEA